MGDIIVEDQTEQEKQANWLIRFASGTLATGLHPAVLSVIIVAVVASSISSQWVGLFREAGVANAQTDINGVPASFSVTGEAEARILVIEFNTPPIRWGVKVEEVWYARGGPPSSPIGPDVVPSEVTNLAAGTTQVRIPFANLPPSGHLVYFRFVYAMTDSQGNAHLQYGKLSHGWMRPE